MDFSQATDILERLIKTGAKHADYDHTVKLANKYKMFITGLKAEDELKRFNPRESDTMHKQRKNLFISITPALVHSVMKPFYKIPRTTPLAAKVVVKKEAEAQSEKIITEFETRFKEFYGSETSSNGMDFYLQNRFMELSFLDPNAWIVVEWDPFDNLMEKPMPRPFEVSSEMAYNFQLKNNKLQWLHVAFEIEMQKPNADANAAKEKGTRHTLYGDNVALIYEQTLFKRGDIPVGTVYDDYQDINGKFYLVRKAATNTGRVPAFRVGYLRDLATNGRSFVAPFHPALPYLEKSLKKVSEHDLTNTLHVFPQKVVRLTQTCNGDLASGEVCINGKTRGGEVCKMCNGTNKPIHTSSQDVVEVEFPENLKEEGFLPLSEFVHYVDLPVELLQFQKESIDELSPLIHEAIFNSTAALKRTPATGNNTQGQGPQKTAYEVDNDMESVYDTLSPFADKYSSAWMAITEMIAILTENNTKVSIIHRFPSSFKLKTRDRLYQEMKFANESSLPAFVLDSISEELAETLFMDEPDELLEYRVKQKHFPFKGKTRTEIMQAMASDLVLKSTKILYNYFDQIFQELELEEKKNAGNFYLKAYKEQADAIAKKVEEYKIRLDEETPKAIPFNTGA